jgi:hypothetical protein
MGYTKVERKLIAIHSVAIYEALLDATDYISRRMPETLGKDDHMKIYNKVIAKIEKSNLGKNIL